MTADELEKQIEELQKPLAELIVELKELESEEEKKNKFLVFFRKVFNPVLLSVLSFVFVLFLIIAYLYWKLFDYERFGAIFSNFSYNDGFFWVFIVFMILCNGVYLKSIISSLVEEKINSEIRSQIKEKARKEIEKVYSKTQGVKKEIESIDVDT